MIWVYESWIMIIYFDFTIFRVERTKVIQICIKYIYLFEFWKQNKICHKMEMCQKCWSNDFVNFRFKTSFRRLVLSVKRQPIFNWHVYKVCHIDKPSSHYLTFLKWLYSLHWFWENRFRHSHMVQQHNTCFLVITKWKLVFTWNMDLKRISLRQLELVLRG